MSELGSIFEEAAGAGAKGPNVRVRAPVQASMVARGESVLITVPDAVPHEGGVVPRRRVPGDPPGEVCLHLSPQLRDGVTLRLRGQGGEHPKSGVPGDLLVTLEVVPDPEGVRWAWVAGLVAVLAAGAAAAWWGLGG
ncbi:MAG: hypothetical protein KDK70_29120 [Myxococcales bacterium]|nr:hypothetical protein [Myxococcales bacterium]